MKLVGKTAFMVLGLTVFLAIWEAGALLAPNLVPHFWEVAAAVHNLIFDSHTQRDILNTLGRALLSFSIAVALGVPLGLLLGSIRTLKLMFNGQVDFFRSIPAFVLLPLFLVFFKSGESSRIAMASFGAGLIVTANTAFGAAHASRLRIEVARVYGAKRFFVLFHVLAREVLPQTLDGLRLAISLSLVLTIVGEIMLGATYGLGTRVNDSLSGFDLPRMYGLIFLIGILGYFFNLVGRLLAGKFVKYGGHL